MRPSRSVVNPTRWSFCTRVPDSPPLGLSQATVAPAPRGIVNPAGQPACLVKRRRGTRPACDRSRTARASAASITRASSGSRPQMKVTTQSSQAAVCCITHSSHEIVSGSLIPPSMTGVYDRSGSRSGLAGLGLLEGLHLPAGTAPATGHLLDDLGEDLLVLHRELAPDRVVMEGARAPRDGDVEPGEVAARSAAVAGDHRRRTLTSPRHGASSAGRV